MSVYYTLEDEKEDRLKALGWVEDRMISGRFVSPRTKISYTLDQACGIQELYEIVDHLRPKESK